MDSDAVRLDLNADFRRVQAGTLVSSGSVSLAESSAMARSDVGGGSSG